MPACSRCPGRFFKDENAVRMHQESKHAFSCGKCNRVLHSQQALDQHISDSHYRFECRFCDKEFTTENGRLSHEKAKHPSTFECEYCDRKFTTDIGRLDHQRAKHEFECHYCDREFSSEDARDQHEDAKHRMFECRYCDREFSSEDARDQHEEAKHLTFECHYCDREFSTEHGRDQHEEAKHPTFECHFCTGEFASEDAREQHENAVHRRSIPCFYCDRKFASADALSLHEVAKHHFECRPCSKSFTRIEALWNHEKCTPHIQCGYCSSKFFTQDAKIGHEQTCGSNPANRTKLLVSAITSRPSSSPSSKGDLSGTVNQLSISSSKSFALPSRSSTSFLEGEEIHRMGLAIVTDKEPTIEQDCACKICQRASSPSSYTTGEGATSEQACICKICQRTASPSAQTDRPVPDDAENLGSADAHHQDDSTGHDDEVFQCTPCIMLFDTAEALRDHVCASRTAMLRSHCPMCYSQFDDELSLQTHLAGVELTCQLCRIRCCSEEMMQDHMLSHPSCNKCGKSFVDNLALCAHVESDHPVVVCWDCDGIVIEKNNLESHYADSPAHPSCAFCGLGKRNSAEMDEHVKHMHPSSAEIDGRLGGGNPNASTGSESPLIERPPPGENSPQFLEKLHCAPPSTMEISGQRDESDGSSSEMESSLSSSQPVVSPQVKQVNEEAGNASIINGPDVDARQYTSPSPTPSEHGSSNASRTQVDATNSAPNGDNARPPSPVSSVSSELFSETSTRHSQASDLSHSIVFVSADGLPDYIRDNRAILVATSAGSHSSGRTSLRLPSSSSFTSMDMVELVPSHVQGVDAGSAKYHLHCRICLRDPCEDMTATICGHLFCKRCITQAVVTKSECPVCHSASLLYCLFKLDLSV